eukprot:670777-Pelagomonas_calceolata.AAC.1
MPVLAKSKCLPRAAGISLEAAEAEDAEKKPKKVVYTNKKTQKKKEEPSKVRVWRLQGAAQAEQHGD